MDSEQTPQQQMLALEGLGEAGEKQEENLNQRKESYDSRVLQTLKDLDLMNELVKDFNRFKALYQMQKQLTEQLQRFDVIRDLSKADELALKKLAATEKIVEEQLRELVKDLRFHAEDAELQFPQAARSAADLADLIENGRLEQLASQGVNSMLIPQGPESYQLADRLKQEMERIFRESGNNQSLGEPNPYMKNEFDQYLSLMMGMSPGETFEQMCRSRKFGKFGKGQKGKGMSGVGGAGNGNTEDGYNQGPQIGLLGNEELGQPENPKEGSGDGKDMRSDNGANAVEVVSVDGDKDLQKNNSIKSRGDAVSTDGLINNYENLIDAYFEKITEE
jgi:hypothetical protein